MSAQLQDVRMRRIFKILCAISLVLCVAAAICWALSAMGYERAFVRARWDDRQTNIQLYMSAAGWRDSTFLNGKVIYQWSANSAQSLDPIRQLLRKKFGDGNQTTRQWIPLPEFVLTPLGGGTASGGDGELYQAPISELTFAYALLPLIWLAWQIYRKWKIRRVDPAVIECEVCGYDMRATPDDQGRYPLNYAP